ncbi:MAG: hypothetical protein QW154_00100 [Sulfolobales archaeon]
MRDVAIFEFSRSPRCFLGISESEHNTIVEYGECMSELGESTRVSEERR